MVAREVSARLGFRHTVVDPRSGLYAPMVEEVLARFEHRAAQHLWAGPLTAAIRANGQRIADGTATDMVMHNTHIPDEVVRAPARAVRNALLIRQLSRPKIRRILTAEAAAWVVSTAERCWQAGFAHLEGDANETILAVLTIRTTRGPGTMAEWLYGPELPVMIPGIDADLIRVAMAVDMERKMGGAFCRDVLALADPVVAAIRSTHDESEQAVPGSTRQDRRRGACLARGACPPGQQREGSGRPRPDACAGDGQDPTGYAA